MKSQVHMYIQWKIWSIMCVDVLCLYGATPRELYNRIVVTFIDKNLPGDTGVTLTLSQRMSYTIVGLPLPLPLYPHSFLPITHKLHL